MNGRYLLDTNIVIAIFADEEAVLARVDSAEDVFVGSIVLGELYYGARKSERFEANVARIDEFAASAAVLGCDSETARHYGRIKNDLRVKGRDSRERHLDRGDRRSARSDCGFARPAFRPRHGPPPRSMVIESSMGPHGRAAGFMSGCRRCLA